MLTGTGADGAYHAGALRALHEAGVKVDVVGGRGIGALGAVLSAVDGAARLWEQGGFWRGPAPATFYRWRWPFRCLRVLLLALLAVLAVPLIALLLVAAVYPIALGLGMAGLDCRRSLRAGHPRGAGRRRSRRRAADLDAAPGPCISIVGLLVLVVGA